MLTLEPGSDNALITPDGTKVVAGTMTQARKSPYATTLAITEFSARSGKHRAFAGPVPVRAARQCCQDRAVERPLGSGR